MALGLISGLATWFAGSPGASWVFGAHTLAGAAVTLLLVFKLRRVLPRVGARAHRDPRTLRGLLALGLVVAVLVSGTVWSTAGRVGVAGYTVLFWHAALGAALAVVVLAHARVRARRPRPRDLTNRRQFLTAAALGAGALAAWQLQRPALRTLGLPGAGRRFTGSYDAGSFTGNAFPTTSWVADRPRPLAGGYRLTVAGRVRRPLAVTAAELDRRDALTATLDCTGGFFSTQHWRGASLGRLLDEAGVRPGARHVRVISRTGYRWSFDLRDARALLLATHVGGVPLSHGRGAPCRLVAPGRRGFSGSSGSSASRSTRIPTRARSPRRSGAASPPPAAAQRTLVYEAYEDAVEWADDDTDEAVLASIHRCGGRWCDRSRGVMVGEA